MEEQRPHVLQWHPAFYAGIQIELETEANTLLFENEHQLGTKPKEIDVLIIKKEKELPVQKNIGRIFRKHNIVEYLSDFFYNPYTQKNPYKSTHFKKECADKASWF